MCFNFIPYIPLSFQMTLLSILEKKIEVIQHELLASNLPTQNLTLSTYSLPLSIPTQRKKLPFFL